MPNANRAARNKRMGNLLTAIVDVVSPPALTCIKAALYDPQTLTAF
jgi:hypothetical protein